MEERSIEELKAEQKRLEEEARELYNQASVIKQNIIARTENSTKDYYGKYLVAYSPNNTAYMKYLHVTNAEHNYGDSYWTLKGDGFVAYVCENGKIHFDTDNYGIDLNDVFGENPYYKVDIITKEKYYADRNEFLTKLMNETYED